MNICLVSQEYPPETGWGGIGTYIWNLALALSREGHNVWVVALASSLRLSKYIDGKVNIIRIHRPPDYFLRTSIGTLVYSIQVAKCVYALAQRLHGDLIVEAPEWFAEAFWLNTHRRNFPVLVKIHTPHFLHARLNHLKSWHAVEWMEHKATKGADQVHAPSKAIATVIGSEWGISLSEIKIVPYPVNTERYRPSLERRNTAPLVCFMGRLERRKGVLTIASAIPRILLVHPQAHFMFIGRDMPDSGGESMRNKIQQLLGPRVLANVTFLDQISRDELVSWYQRARITLVPSLWENFPNVCLEAMACGSAVIASNTGGIAEIIDDGINGILIPPNLPEQLVDTVNTLLDKPAICYDLGVKAVEKIKQDYELSTIARNTLKYYQQVSEAFIERT